MKTGSHKDELIPPALLAEIEAMAAAEHRHARDMVREAVERYVGERRSHAAKPAEPQPRPKLTAQEAGARILARRKGNVLPEGVTIRDLQTYGRS